MIFILNFLVVLASFTLSPMNSLAQSGPIGPRPTICLQVNDQFQLPITEIPFYIEPGQLKPTYEGRPLFVKSPYTAWKGYTTYELILLKNLSLLVLISDDKGQFSFPMVNFQFLDGLYYASIQVRALIPSETSQILVFIRRSSLTHTNFDKALDVRITQEVSECSSF